MPKVLVPLAQGCEELEAVTIIDLLRRAGVEVVVAGLEKGPVTASRGVVLMPDVDLDEALTQDYDMVVLPGGMPGATHLANDVRLIDFLKKMAAAGKFTAAICAAPLVLAQAGILSGKKATAYPGMLEEKYADVQYTGNPVEKDGKIITSRGPGTALDFSLVLITELCGKDVRNRVEKGLVR